MVDINKWNRCADGNPEKKGKYLLLVGVPNKRTGAPQLGVIDGTWNGKQWMVKDRYSAVSWKYKKPGEIDKYPDFEANLIRESIS